METRPCLDASCFIPALPVTRQITSALQHRISIFNVLQISGARREEREREFVQTAPAIFISKFQIEIMRHVLPIFPWLPPYHVTAPAAPSWPDLTQTDLRIEMTIIQLHKISSIIPIWLLSAENLFEAEVNRPWSELSGIAGMFYARYPLLPNRHYNHWVCS